MKEIRKELGKKKQTKLSARDEFRSIVNALMTQISKDDEYAQVSHKKGKRKHGNLTVKAMLQEWVQLVEGDTQNFIPMLVSRLSKDDKHNTLRVLSLVKKNGVVSSRGELLLTAGSSDNTLRRRVLLHQLYI